MSRKNRGINIIFNDLLRKEEVKHRKGRSILFNDQRNECLVDRYLFYLRTEKRYDAIIKIMSIEFFLSEVTIMNILTGNYDKIATLKKEYQDYSETKLKKALLKKWAHLSWDLPKVIFQ